MRKTEFRERYLAIVRERLGKLRQDGKWRVSKAGVASRRAGMDSLADRIRTPGNIEAERKFRQRELIEVGMMSLTSETLLL
jgi:hypothetical protein